DFSDEEFPLTRMDQCLDLFISGSVGSARRCLKIEKTVLCSEERLSLERKPTSCDLLEMRIDQVESAFFFRKAREDLIEAILLLLASFSRSDRRNLTNLGEALRLRRRSGRPLNSSLRRWKCMSSRPL